MTSFAVVGAGLVGSATAWALASRGHDVTILERTTPANAEASSHGSARIARYAYLDPFHADLMVQARPVWDELAAASGRSVFTPTDALDIAPPDRIAQITEVFRAVGVEHEIIEPEVAAERWPGIRPDGQVLWHGGAGVVDAEAAVHAMVDLAVQAGADVREHWEVVAVRREDGGFLVESSSGDTVHVERVVVVAGPWLTELADALPLSDAGRSSLPALEVRQEQVFHFPYRDDASWPVVIHTTETGQSYALPGGRDAGDRGFKVATYRGGHVVDSPADADHLVRDAARKKVVALVRDLFPGLEPQPYAEATCLFTSTPNEDFVFRHDAGLSIVAACSGHAAKFAPLLGRIFATGAEGGAVPERFTR